MSYQWSDEGSGWAEEGKLFQDFCCAVASSLDPVQVRASRAVAILNEMDALKQKCLEDWDETAFRLVKSMANHLAYVFPVIVRESLRPAGEPVNLSVVRLQRRIERMAGEYKGLLNYEAN